MEKMRERGTFIEYAKGEMVQGDGTDAITSGEEGENGGMRLCYFHREEYPEIYERKQEIKDACQSAIRRVLALLK